MSPRKRAVCNLTEVFGSEGPEGFTWRGIRFSPPGRTEPGGFYKSGPIELDAHRTGDWKVHCPKTVWHARLRIGSDRHPGVGATREQALEDAAAEAQNVATYIVAMLPAARELAARIGAGPAPKKRTRRAVKVRR